MRFGVPGPLAVWNERGEAALAVSGRAAAAIRAEAEVWRLVLAIRQGRSGTGQTAETLRAYEKVAAPVDRARAEWLLAAAIIDHGDEAAARELLDRSLDTFRAEVDRWGEAAVLSCRAMLAHMRGDAAAALAWHREGFDDAARQRAAYGLAWGLEGMAAALAADARGELAARLLGAAAAVRERGLGTPDANRDELERVADAVRAAEPDFEALFERGRELTPEQARSLVDGDRA